MFISPMLLQYSKNNEPFNKPNHISELKLDGFRLIVSNMDKLRLYTRHNNLVTNRFPELFECPLPAGTIIDGELIVEDPEGKPDFEALQARFQSKKNKTPVSFCAFDIIKYKGIDVYGLPLMKRKEILEESFMGSQHYKKVKTFEGNAIDYFNLVSQHGLEGIVIKYKNSLYEINKRSWSWQKVINWTYVDVYISGYRKNEFGLLISIDDATNGLKRNVGIVEFGVLPHHKEALRSVKKRLIYKEDANFAYMEPLIKARIKTRNWTKNGMLRSPVFCEFLI
ncbi:RNA ligase family protein [Paenibacillus vulneris]|uniref:DNA ligase n=1 Tax=Paenibacillus vulneris TaxID=1133364 RepID=A0ABW3UI22_9BACL